MKTTRIIALMAVALPMAFISCSDDDDEGGSPKVSNSVFAGYQLTSVKVGSNERYAFEYDEEGRCTYIYDWGDKYYIEQPGFKITADWEDEDNNISVSFNGDGYVSKIVENFSDEYSGYVDAWTSTWTLSYSGGYLTKVDYSAVNKYTEDGYTETYKETGSLTLTWENNNLTKMEGKLSGSNGDSETDTYTFEYDDDVNGCQQCPITILDQIVDWNDYADCFGLPGYLGKGPAYLPTSWKVEYVKSYSDEDDDDPHTYSGSCSFTTYSDGRIKTEYYDGSTYTYSYASYDDEDDTRAAVATPFDDAISPATNPLKGIHGMKNRLHARHAAKAQAAQ
ncbi:MAG: hypothetical protein LUC33_03010 [Prevotellaceae bacterium]|nr:hypothetical protein [Prevotellaceae bacterium]